MTDPSSVAVTSHSLRGLLVVTELIRNSASSASSPVRAARAASHGPTGGQSVASLFRSALESRRDSSETVSPIPS